jgi:spore germination protein YaaH
MNSDSTPAPSPRGEPRGNSRVGPVAVRLAAGLAVAIGMAWFGVPRAVAIVPAGSEDPGVGSAMYRESLEHADDPNTFTPGDAVVMPYVPRRGDVTPIDGGRPVALAAGTATGRSMAQEQAGSPHAVNDALEPAGDSAEASLGPAAASAAQTAAVPASTTTLRREVLGYLPYWESPYSGELNYDVLSTVAYFGVTVRGNGDLAKSTNGVTTTEWAGWTSSWMTNVINAAHAHGTRVLLSVEQFAWTAGGRDTQVMLLSSADYRAHAIDQIVAAVTQRGVDGVSLDFEPIVSTQSFNFVTFVRELRTALDAVRPGYEIVYCATGSIGYYDHYKLTGLGAADAVFIMGYDFRTGSSGYAGSIDPLTSPRAVYDLTQVIKGYKTKTTVDKIILGLPWYGIAWSTVSNAPNATTRSSGCSATSVLFAQAALLASQNGRNYDSIEQSAWTAYQLDCGDKDANGQPVKTWRELYYDDAQSLGVKYDMINYWNLRGMGIWALGYDHGHPEMTALIGSKFVDDRTPPVVGISNMKSSQDSEGFPVSWTGYDDWNGVAGYDVQVSEDGGAWTSWLTGTTETSDAFEGQSGHNYSFRARGTDGAGNVGPWDVTSVYTGSPSFGIGGYIRVTTSTLNEREGPSTGSTVIGTASAGTVLKIIDGPVATSDNLTWYQVTGPYTTVNATTPLFPGLWVAVSNGPTDYAVPITPPNTTTVVAGIANYSVGVPGMLPSGTGIDRGKAFSPDGDGIHDTLPMSWTNTRAMDSVTLNFLAADGTSAGSINLGAQGAGPQSFVWDGKVGGSVIPDGTYMIQVAGVSGGATYYAPSAAPFGSWQMSRMAATVDTTPSGTYYPITPVRIVDTRYGLGIKGGPLVSGGTQSVLIAGALAGVPKGAMAITGNLTITAPTSPGYVRLGPSVSENFSTINFAAGQTRANGVTVGLSSDGKLSVYYYGSIAKSTVHVILDITGYFVQDPNGATFVPVSPYRIVDTRYKTSQLYGALPARKVFSFSVSGVPSNAIAVTGNATVTGPTGNGYITVAPAILPNIQPPVSTVNFARGETGANNVTLKLAGGKLQVEYWGPVGTYAYFVFDVTGYFLPGLSGATFVPLTPGRVVDSRTPFGLSGPLKTGQTGTVTVSGQVSVHPIAVAVVGNLTNAKASSSGWMAAGPGPVTNTSTVNFVAKENRANGFTCLLGPGGRLAITFKGTSGSYANVVVDIVGYYR